MTFYAATGHRPDKLGGYSKATEDRLRKLARRYLEVDTPDQGVISGMALGWDMAWAEAAVELGIEFTAAVPFAGQESTWPTAARDRYNKLLGKAADVMVVCTGRYEPWKMDLRNHWMVDHSSKLIALWNGTKGGTFNCVLYAQAAQREIVNLWPYWSK
jgi:uncharacterized phage-like protein YoqJ